MPVGMRGAVYSPAASLTTLRLSPYITGRIGQARYLLRNDNIWVKGSGGTGLAFRDSYQNVATAQIGTTPLPIGWELTYNRTDTKYEDQPSLGNDVARAKVTYQFGPALQLSAMNGPLARSERA